jgi:predicted transcriptional regulator
MKRSREEIIALILETCCEKTNKTQIVYRCNLSFQNAQPHIDLLLRSGLLEKLSSPTFSYRTTERGMEALGYLKSYWAMLDQSARSGD